MDYSHACVPLPFSSFSIMLLLGLLLQVAPPACHVPQASPERRQLSPGGLTGCTQQKQPKETRQMLFSLFLEGRSWGSKGISLELQLLWAASHAKVFLEALKI